MNSERNNREHSLQMHGRFLTSLETYRPKSSAFNVLHHNIHSLPSKIDSYRAMPFIQSYDCISVSETWLQPNCCSGLVSLPNFTIFRCDRSDGRKGGGAALYLKDSHNAQELNGLSLSTADTVWVKIKLPNRKPLIIGSIYRSPGASTAQFLQEFSDLLLDPCLNSAEVLLAGDFNINWNCNGSHKCALLNATAQLNLAQSITGFTYVAPQSAHETLIDLVFTSSSLQVLTSKTLVTDVSDHYAVSTSINIKRKREPRCVVSSRNFKSGLASMGMDSYCNEILIEQIASSSTVDDQAELLESWVTSVVDEHAPLKFVRVRPDSPRWLTSSLKKMISHKNRLFRNICQSNINNVEEWDKYKKARNLVQSSLRKAKKVFVREQLTKDTTTFFRETKRLMGHGKTNNPPTEILNKHGELTKNSAETALAFNKFFTSIDSPPPTSLTTASVSDCSAPPFSFKAVDLHDTARILNKLDNRKRGGIQQFPAAVYKCLSPTVVPALTVIINTCFQKSTFPSIYKRALVTPVYKKGDKHVPGNYRPISSLPILSKVLESAINGQISAHIEQHGLLSPKQFGFRRKTSSEHLLLLLTNQILTLLDSTTPQHIVLVSLDIKKAFDTVDHHLLLHKLDCLYNFSPKSVSLISSYLMDRVQYMRAGKAISPACTISKGVPQGSILGPLLFNIMINDMLSTCRDSYSYADDTTVLFSRPTLLESLHHSSEVVQSLQTWYTNNGFSLNLSKTNCMLWTNRKTTLPKSINISGTEVPVSSTSTVLGIALDSKLNFNEHIQQLSSQFSSLLYSLRKVRCLLTKKEAVLLYSSIIRPRLEYCSTLFLGTSKESHLALERCQNRAIRTILGIRTRDIFSATSGRRLLGLHTLTSRRESRFLRLVSKAIKGSCPQLVSHDLLGNSTFKSHRKTRNSAHTSYNMNLPCVRTGYGKRSLRYQAALCCRGLRSSSFGIPSYDLKQ